MATAAVDKTVNDLRHEIAELYRQNREINERLNRRRLGRGGFARPIGGRGGRGRIRKAENDLEGEPSTKKLSSAVVKLNGEPDSAEIAEPENQADDVKEQQQSLTSGHGRRRGFTNEERSETTPRDFSKVDDPKLAKRNRRMFGALLGTLEKFRQEELSHSETVMRRSDSVKRAVQKAQEESEKLRQQERETNAERRKRDLMLRAKLSAKVEEKQIELLFMQWTEHKSKLSTYLKTKAEPGLYYMPLRQTERDRKKLEEQQREFEEWKLKCRGELDEHLNEIKETYLAKAQAEIDKIGRYRRRGHNKEEEEANATMEEHAMEENDHQNDDMQQQEEEAVADVMEEEDDEDTTLVPRI